MPDLSFEWDLNKAAANSTKRRVTFEDAKTVFFDEKALVIPDPDHSLVEERFIIMGMSQSLSILVVAHCYRKKNSVIRIISARKAGAKEQKPYWNQPK
jgi:uncharacterized DUF497 family protein